MAEAWALGPAGLYVLASFGHAALVEGNLTVEVAFGRSLAFWVGASYLGLLLWGLLPAQPRGRYTTPRALLALTLIGAISLVACLAVAALWLARWWVPAIGGPAALSLVALASLALGVLWLAGREDRPAREQ